MSSSKRVSHPLSTKNVKDILLKTNSFQVIIFQEITRRYTKLWRIYKIMQKSDFTGLALSLPHESQWGKEGAPDFLHLWCKLFNWIIICFGRDNIIKWCNPDSDKQPSNHSCKNATCTRKYQLDLNVVKAIIHKILYNS